MRAPRSFSGPRKVAVKPAGSKGRGVFAALPIRKGETIEIAPALLIPREESDEFLATFLAHYIFKTDRGQRYVLALGFASLFNHDRKPNAEFFVERSHIRIAAIKAIPTGREITVDYGWTKQEWATIGGVSTTTGAD